MISISTVEKTRIPEGHTISLSYGDTNGHEVVQFIEVRNSAMGELIAARILDEMSMSYVPLAPDAEAMPEWATAWLAEHGIGNLSV